jgi:hypothetical protein
MFLKNLSIINIKIKKNKINFKIRDNLHTKNLIIYLKYMGLLNYFISDGFYFVSLHCKNNRIILKSLNFIKTNNCPKLSFKKSFKINSVVNSFNVNSLNSNYFNHNSSYIKHSYGYITIKF